MVTQRWISDQADEVEGQAVAHLSVVVLAVEQVCILLSRYFSAHPGSALDSRQARGRADRRMDANNQVPSATRNAEKKGPAPAEDPLWSSSTPDVWPTSQKENAAPIPAKASSTGLTQQSIPTGPKASLSNVKKSWAQIARYVSH